MEAENSENRGFKGAVSGAGLACLQPFDRTEQPTALR
jgi:hypothetical protein